ncbi:MAG: DegT/DnrJ/EryC1/StrS family aminotransferase [Gemmataceae bacterium]|nr:DegT/DnrJ/EryC1/StrS family aminotransferase [Gemmataceae bacterium]MDW8266458.1 DegT/DnrJ/EryC1/StrS family aminotransferase [Gemmataceae bacterium]
MSVTTDPGVPLCDLQQQYRELQAEIEAAVGRVLASGQFILGPDVAALEEEVARYCGAAYGVGCGSGTDALLLALSALGVGPGDEVIVPPFTFFATVGAICRLGARPVFADIDPLTCNLDPVQVESKVTPRTRAIIPVHLYGQCVDMEPLWQTAERRHVILIEDAAQAIGAEYQGKRTGTLGAMACFSFYPSKNLGTYGDAGMVVTNDAEWAKRMASLRVHGMEPKYYHKHIGWNARLDTIHAAILRVKLAHLDHWIALRQAAAARYDALIERYHLTGFLQRPVVRPKRRHVFNQYVVRVPAGQRDALAAYLRSQRIGCEIYYPVPVHLQECLAYLGHRPGDFPASEEASATVLALPMFPEISEAQQRRVVEACAAFLRQRARLVA